KVVLRRYFEHAARQQPLALVLEDLHWADPSSLDVLEQLLGLTDRVPLLILALMRVDHDHGSWNVTNKARTDFPHRYEEIYLRRLLAVDTAELLTGLMGAGSFPQELRELILSRAEGNPFYLEEVVRHLQENNLLTLVDGEWTLSSELDALGIPDTLQGVLLARIDRLEGAVRETLQLAAVIGRSFLYRILASISEAERQLDEHLTELQRGELVREKTRLPELEYVFKHALTQEAAYGSLLHERRKRFHLLVGEAIEKLFPDRQEEYLGLLAYHFEKGEQPGKAAPYLVRAGDHARMEDLLPEAEAYYQRAIGCLKVLGQGEGLAQTTMKLALVYQARSMFDAAHRTYSEAFKLMETTCSSNAASKKDRETTDGAPVILRTPVREDFRRINLDAFNSQMEAWVFKLLFAGLVDIDQDLNVVPHAASSWEILDNGKRYLFHLRPDVYWSDGQQVTAEDYRWTLLRFLDPESYTTYLDDIVGATDYRTGVSTDSDSVGVQALSPLTLEVRLNCPVSHFLYLMAMAVGCVVPSRLVGEYGSEWWKPPQVICSGPFVLTRFDERGGEMKRNPMYFGPAIGTIDGVRWQVYESHDEILESYLENDSDVVLNPLQRVVQGRIDPQELLYPPQTLWTNYLLLNPCLPPTENLHVRRAIAHAVNRDSFLEQWGDPTAKAASGGLVPPGMPGHSPKLALEFNLEAGRKSLEDSSFSDKFHNVELTLIEGVLPFSPWLPVFGRELQESLGCRTTYKLVDNIANAIEFNPHAYITGWAADFPEPVNFLVQGAYDLLHELFGWEDQDYRELIQRASMELDRKTRMELYRAADRYLVSDQVLVIPLAYRGAPPDLVKPWVSNFRKNALVLYDLKDVVIDTELRARMTRGN
ncbi:MAG: ABC transporter substrate-binding protein, partial [Anaerolineales bacterium]